MCNCKKDIEVILEKIIGVQNDLIIMILNDLIQIQSDLNIGAGMHTDKAYDDLVKRLDLIASEMKGNDHGECS